MDTFNTIELSFFEPDAFKALPEPYQNDDCLAFYQEEGRLYAKPAPGQENALGRWVAMFQPETNEWVQTLFRG